AARQARPAHRPAHPGPQRGPHRGAAPARPGRDLRGDPHPGPRHPHDADGGLMPPEPAREQAGVRLVVVHPDKEVLAQAAAARLLTRVLDVQSVRSPVHVVLTGGTVGIATLAAAATSPLLRAIDWSPVHLWWGDERLL